MILDFNNISQIKQAGFEGFKTKGELCLDSSSIPKIKGVYLVLYPESKVSFLPVGTGGFFKGKNPNISLETLQKNWIDSAKVVCIGKAGSNNGNATLHSRLKQYLKFRQGKNIGHWGGRLIWQLANAKDLIVCWKTLPDNEPREIEGFLI
jgi:hypothetical protein